MKDERQNSSSTEVLYENDSYTHTFRATILEARLLDAEDGTKQAAVILDRTYFFPEGGGQDSDTGWIGGIFVPDVQSRDGEILHLLSSVPEDFDLWNGREADCRIDFAGRFQKMQNHSGEHLLCGLIHNRFGYDNVGFHISDATVTLDVNGPLTQEELAELEEQANRVICENVPILVRYPSPEELSGIDYRSKLELTEGVRLVEIAGYDICACCAPHVRSTGEIGILKVTESFPHRGGTRIVMIAGLAAFKDYRMLDQQNRALMKLFSAKREETLAAAERISEKNQELLAEISELKKRITRFTLDEILSQISGRTDDSRPFLVFVQEMDDTQFRNLINECTAAYSGVVIGFLGDDANGYRYIASVANEQVPNQLPELAKQINSTLNGRGGGTKQMIQGRVSAPRAEIERVLG